MLLAVADATCQSACQEGYAKGKVFNLEATCAPAFRGKNSACRHIVNILFVSILCMGLATAQTTVNPPTNTVQVATPVTGPDGGLVLYGTALSPVTQQPMRHLWIADASAGICRLDPDLDSAGPYAINPTTCAFAVNGSSVIGGGMAFDATSNLLYLTDNQRLSQGVLRINYLPSGDNGNGALDFTTAFSLGGNITANTFPAGQTGCGLPGSPTFPNSAALDPQGNLWVGFAKSGAILRFNNPGSVTGASNTPCPQFIQLAATVPNNRVGSGLAWIGHDLWGADPESPFVIRFADTACAMPPSAACSTANGTVATALSSIAAPTSLISDQIYPAVNGNNLYFGLGTDVAWVGNVTGGSSAQTITLSYTNSAQSANPLSNVGAVVLDATDPANLVLYTGDDPSGLGTAGAGRWFQTVQSPAVPDVPGTPLNVVATIVNGQATLSWSPAQAGQPVTSYTIHNSFSSSETLLPDIPVVPVSGAFPPTSATFTVAPNVAYQFQVSASNGQGSSPLSLPSNLAPLIPIPGAPTAVQAIAGDTQAYVSWTPPANTAGGITSYTVTAFVNGTPAGISATVPASASTPTNAVISGLNNGTNYTFTVHASTSSASGAESVPSNSITPSNTNLPVMRVLVTGPVAEQNTPVIVTYEVTVTNTSLFPVNSIIANNFLTTTDTSFIIAAEPQQGTCSPGGVGVTNVACQLGDMAPGAVVTIDVVVLMQKSQITLTSRVTGLDANGDSLTFKQEHRSTGSGNPPPGSAQSVSVPVSANATPTTLNPGQSGKFVWTVQNTTGVVANNVSFAISIDTGLIINSVVVSPNSGSDPAFCNAPAPGLANTNLITCNMTSLGGSKTSNPVTLMTVTVNVTAPNRTGLTFLPSGTVSFDGTNSSNPTATLVIKVK